MDVPYSSQIYAMKRRDLNFVDVFAGAGGFSLGAMRGGFQCLGAIEKDARAAETYAWNFPRHVDLPLTFLGPRKGDIVGISKKVVDQALMDIGCDDVDVLLAGPPCQAFSFAGRAKLNSLANWEGAYESDPRNRLYLKFLQLLQWLNPRVFLFENVTGMLHLRGNNVAEIISRDASHLGYNVIYTILNSAWYGVPQTRERVFILGLRNDLGVPPSFPQPSYVVEGASDHLSRIGIPRKGFPESPFFRRVANPVTGDPAIDVESALGDLPEFLDHVRSSDYCAKRSECKPRPYRQGRPNRFASLMRNWSGLPISDAVTDHFCRHTPRDYRVFAKMKPGDRYPEALKVAEKLFRKTFRRYELGLSKNRPVRKEFVPPYRSDAFPDKWKKLDPSKPSWTITAHLSRDCYSHIHYDDNQQRTITVREAARLQTFPDAFLFSGNMGECYTQIGNAVPPILAYKLSRHLRSLLAKADRQAR